MFIAVDEIADAVRSAVFDSVARPCTLSSELVEDSKKRSMTNLIMTLANACCGIIYFVRPCTPSGIRGRISRGRIRLRNTGVSCLF